MEQRFATDDACRDYLFQLRWPTGFVCPRCAATSAWPATRGRFVCRSCRHQTSVTAGTIFENTRKPLTLWFRAIWFVTSQKNGASAANIQQILGLGSYQTAWTWLHKLRRAMVRPGREKLYGVVEVDETFVGGADPKEGTWIEQKAIVVVGAEEDGTRIGRIRLATVPASICEGFDRTWKCRTHRRLGGVHWHREARVQAQTNSAPWAEREERCKQTFAPCAPRCIVVEALVAWNAPRCGEC